MTEVNLSQLRSANPLDTKDIDGCDKNIDVIHSLDNAGHTNEGWDVNTQNEIHRLRGDNEAQGKRVEELTVYIQQAAQGNNR